ncbi:MAG: aconitate hydratase 1 [Candidatus Parvarchaeum acidophilus ARMAN-5]|jgi:aconitate hydratase|uniref:Aconitate hydratase 1 n=1 Tax=Candidatus Parvarchaeum acidophilus ARMAN-5 TaxID=662762 RepID=D6GVJ7_PARA5|nr:MAG: aconitate hydratase 1 [Candidatus Parvarchaeum acidophilus ARMAN-5]
MVLDKEEISKKFNVNGKEINYYSLKELEKKGHNISQLPFSMRVVLESLIRNLDNKSVKEEDVINIANWNPKELNDRDVPFKVSRVLMQDFTGVPAVVDIAAIRDYISKKGEDPASVEPLMKVDLIIDHSVQIDAFGTEEAFKINQEKEVERNGERYKLLKWASQAFKSFNVFPPSAGICHQVNLEYLGEVVHFDKRNNMAYPDTLVGTDSHTTMIDGLGVVGFGVGGIEAEAALLNQPVSFTTPKVLGVNLKGKLGKGITAMDLALTLTKKFREKGVVGWFIEYYGEGVKSLSLPDRATISNMCPEYGATISFFPVDDETLNYMRQTGREEEQIQLIKEYYTAQGMFNMDYSNIAFSDAIELDLGSVEPSVSGPSNPKQAVPLSMVPSTFINAFIKGTNAQSLSPSLKEEARLGSESNLVEPDNSITERKEKDLKKERIKFDDGSEEDFSDGDIVISAITSCTNTSNPLAMVAAGLLARNAVEKGLTINKKVKTSLAPGSRVVTEYLKKAGLDVYLDKLGYSLVGYGCTTCIGNSGPLVSEVSKAIKEKGISTASVLSGNRNYEARIHNEVKGNYLMSPPLVVAFGIAGSILKDLSKEPLGKDKGGKDVYLKDIWPSDEEIRKVVDATLSPNEFKEKYKDNLKDVNPFWNKLPPANGLLYEWEDSSTYIRLPPFFDGFDPSKDVSATSIENAATLAVFGDSISTDHISPAGSIPKNSPAGEYLLGKGVKLEEFNTYGSRRGNHEVMMRGTFANTRIKNLLLEGVEGGYTLHFPDKEKTSIYDAAMKYKEEKRPLVIFGGIEYGSGSSRDWAAKGPSLLGVKAVIAKSFERIHRSNLVGMGVLPLQFKDKEDAFTLGIDFSKPIEIVIGSDFKPRSELTLRYYGSDGQKKDTNVTARIDSEIEMEYYKYGGVLNYVIKKRLENGS